MIKNCLFNMLGFFNVKYNFLVLNEKYENSFLFKLIIILSLYWFLEFLRFYGIYGIWFKIILKYFVSIICW